jgi:hypothetical protein
VFIRVHPWLFIFAVFKFNFDFALADLMLKKMETSSLGRVAKWQTRVA